MLALLAVAAACGCRAQPQAPRDPPLVLEQTIALKGVVGRIDHLAIDVAHRRVFVAELGGGGVEAIDLARGASLGRIAGLKEPQGLAYLPAHDELAVATGGDGYVRFYRAADLRLAGSVKVGGDADDLRVDPAGRVVVGYGAGGLATIDPTTLKLASVLPLPVHPEGFQLSDGRAFVNLPDRRAIAVGDLATGRILRTWPGAYGWNFPMALDPVHQTLAVVYRLPARLQLFDVAAGKIRLDRPTCGDADDVFFDAVRHRVYVVCGAGAVDVIDPARPDAAALIRTRTGARTGLYSPELDRLFVAARAGAIAPAALLIFKPLP
jgi:hypothetical protein